MVFLGKLSRTGQPSPAKYLGLQGQAKLAPALWLFALTTPILIWPWALGGMAIPWDAKAHFLPQIQFLAKSLSSGESPFWSPYVFGGHPQIADPQALLFSPFYLALSLVDGTPDPWVVDMVLIGMVSAAGVCLMVWARDQSWHWGAALIAALCFCWGASMAWRIQHVGQVLSLAWMPIALLCLDRVTRRASLIWALLAGVALTRIALGRDQVALLVLYLLAAYTVWRLLSPPDSGIDRKRVFAALALSALLALALSALPVVLTALLAQDSNRPEIGLVDAGRGSLHPALLLTLIAPDLFGATGRGSYWGPPSAAWPNTGLFLAQNMGGLYFGALPLLLVAMAGLRGWLWSPDIRFFTIAAIVAALYALGWYTPVFGVFHAWVPAVDLFRRPADATFVMGALMALLAGYSANRLLEQHRDSKATASVGVGFVAGLAIGLAGLAIVCGVVFAWKLDHLASLTLPLAESSISIALAAVVLAWARYPHSSPNKVAAAMALITALDLAYHNGPSSATAQPASLYEVLAPETNNDTISALKARAVINEVRRDRVELVGLGFHWPNASLTHGLENTLGYNPLRLGLYSEATGAGDHAALPDQRKFSPLFPSYRCQLANLLGLRFIASGVPIETIDQRLQPGELRLVARTKEAWIYENTEALPRILFATSAKLADFDLIMANGEWPDANLADTVLLEEQVDNSEQVRKPGHARLSRYTNTLIEVEVESPDGGWLVLNDVWHPWWFASLGNGADSRELEVLRANVLFRAVAVEPGSHIIRFEFRPVEGALNQLMGSREP